MKTRRKITLALLLLALLGAGAFFAWRSIVPGRADMNEIRARVWPKLQNELDAFGLASSGPLFIRIFKQEKELEIWGIEKKRHVQEI